MIYNTFILTKMNYSAAAWQPRLSTTQRGVLERVQNKALRMITGQLKSSPAEALLAETDCLSIETSANRACLLSIEKAKRLPEKHPRRLAWESAVPKKNDRKSWFTRGTELSVKIPADAEDRAPFPPPQVAPWINDREIVVYPTMPGIKGRSDEIAVKRAASIARINELRPDITIYTDGCADGGCRQGGSAMQRIQ